MLVEAHRLLDAGERRLRDLTEVAREHGVEREPDRERQEVAERERGLVERAAEHLGDALGERGLRLFEARERDVEPRARAVVVVAELVLDVGQRARRELRERRHGTNGGPPDPHQPRTVARERAPRRKKVRARRLEAVNAASRGRSRAGPSLRRRPSAGARARRRGRPSRRSRPLAAAARRAPCP